LNFNPEGIFLDPEAVEASRYCSVSQNFFSQAPSGFKK
jgi:hypothetical protein